MNTSDTTGKDTHKTQKSFSAVWWGTQTDEAFPEAWHSDAAVVSGRSKVYVPPKLWYLRVNVIEARDLIPNDRTRFPKVLVKAVLGHQALRTMISMNKSTSPMWNEDLMFVAAEPFDEHLILSVEDRVAPNKDEVLGMCVIPLQYVDRRLDHTAVKTRWFDLENHVIVDGVKTQVKLASKIHMRVCLEGGYHVLHESVDYISDYRPTAKQLWKKSIGVLEVGILSAHRLSPMKTKDGRETTDAYCVAKYGTKWVRTRTIIDSLMPKWNEQYTWDVYDLCTVITIGVFDNCLLQGARDSRIGRVRIRLSTLETDRVYTLSYPLLVLHPSGLKEMGKIHLAVRFTCSSLHNMMEIYSQPLLPKMHYIHPLTFAQLDTLRHHATHILSMRLSRAEPPLRKEVVEFMLDKGSHMWSMRRGKANFFRIMGALGGLIAVGKWFDHIYNWKNTLVTVLMYLVFVILVVYPENILLSILLYLFIYGLWCYIGRPKNPPHIDTRISFADNVLPDELDEEFDTFPTSRLADMIVTNPTQ
ncbi:FT-interacting protein 1-like protein [Tanacetum coccineum]|uniref:FT-interacting protein 1-like protein n=1 Tax=Tanacetum coccineum TaxID=301880 RepID=A0ABQ5F5K5_9ASTR